MEKRLQIIFLVVLSIILIVVISSITLGSAISGGSLKTIANIIDPVHSLSNIWPLYNFFPLLRSFITIPFFIIWCISIAIILLYLLRLFDDKGLFVFSLIFVIILLLLSFSASILFKAPIQKKGIENLITSNGEIIPEAYDCYKESPYAIYGQCVLNVALKKENKEDSISVCNTLKHDFEIAGSRMASSSGREDCLYKLVMLKNDTSYCKYIDFEDYPGTVWPLCSNSSIK